MITGYIDDNLEARARLRIVHKELIEDVEFLVDTGFNGHLAVPASLVTRLDLQPGAVQRGITADGRLGFYDTVEVQVIWHEHPPVLVPNRFPPAQDRSGMVRLQGRWLVAKPSSTGTAPDGAHRNR